MKLVEVYKSSRKPGAYLYVERGSDLADLPEGSAGSVWRPGARAVAVTHGRSSACPLHRC